ncbi:ROK family transcriptional regulator [Enterococcus dongliensis]|uniref:ROK family transcriptional regulator n=1 Tax=Enterococcus dongliensis TaxID=2559925 RepID=UPI0028907CA9|nr:ROK family transcriptional regulator [Enterococcus dongliensis]MDT2613921.1 ROK family transcriptional regulator [Enterococcus dongliensis]
MQLSTIRKNNKEAILDLLFRTPNLSKKKIAKDLNLSPSVISKLCNELIQEEKIRESSQIESKRAGRKEIGLVLNESYGYVIGLTINHFQTTIILTDLNRNPIEKLVIPTSDNSQTYFELLIKTLRELISHLQMSQRILGIGISIKGRTDGIYSYSGIWSHPQDVKHTLENQLNLPVIMDNGVRATALQAQFEKDLSNFAFIKYVDAGIGGALIENGIIKLGESHSIAEFGHMIVDPTREYCPICKRRGCLESIASIEELYREIRKELTPERFPILWNHIKENPDNLSMTEINLSVAEGSIELNRIFQKYAHYFALNLINFNTIVDRKHILLAGEIFHSKQFQIYLQGELASLQLVPLWEQIEFYHSYDENLSAVFLAINQLFLTLPV